MRPKTTNKTLMPLIFAVILILGGLAVCSQYEASLAIAQPGNAAVAVAPLRPAMAQAPKEYPKQADFLFVQTAKGMTFDKSTSRLTLQGVSPITVFFSDRPERIAGNMETTAFVPFWSTGKDSFLSDAPNADVSILEGDKLRQIVVVLQTPVLEGNALTYNVKVLQGEMPARADDVSVFIDIIGMPMTPVSYAGVARRTYRRAYYYR